MYYLVRKVKYMLFLLICIWSQFFLSSIHILNFFFNYFFIRLKILILHDLGAKSSSRLETINLISNYGKFLIKKELNKLINFVLI